MSAPTGERSTVALLDAAGVVLLRTNDTGAESAGESVARWLQAEARLGPDECSDLSLAVAQVIMADPP